MTLHSIRSGALILVGLIGCSFNLLAEDNVTKELADLKSQLAQRDAELQAAGKQLEELGKREDAATKELADLKSQLAQRDAELQAAGKQLEEFVENIKLLTAQKERDAEAITRLNREKEDAAANWKKKLEDELELQAGETKRKTALELEQSYVEGYIQALRQLKISGYESTTGQARKD